MSARLFDVILGRWKVFLWLVVLLPGLLAAAGLTVLQRTEASAGLWAQVVPSAAGQTGASSGTSTPAQAQADTIMQVVPTAAFAEALRLALDRAQVGFDAAERRQLSADAGRQLKATAVGAHLVVLAYPCDLPSSCVKVLKAAIEAYKDQAQKLQTAQSDQERVNLGSRLDDAQNALSQAEAAQGSYLRQHPELTPSSGSTDPKLNLLQNQVATASQEVNSLQSKLTELQVAAASRGADNAVSVLDPPHLRQRGVIGEGGIDQAAAIFGGFLVLAGAYLAFLARRDDGARDPRELERRIHVPVLTTLPRFSSMRRF